MSLQNVFKYLITKKLNLGFIFLMFILISISGSSCAQSITPSRADLKLTIQRIDINNLYTSESIIRVKITQAIYEYLNDFVYSISLYSVNYDSTLNASIIEFKITKGGLVEWSDSELALLENVPFSPEFYKTIGDKLGLEWTSSSALLCNSTIRCTTDDLYNFINSEDTLVIAAAQSEMMLVDELSIVQVNCTTTRYLVNDLEDLSDINVSDCICNNTNDKCSLRAAIEQAESGDTVFFDASIDFDSIGLDSQIIIDKNLVFIGNGKGKTIISGQRLDRIFRIEVGTEVNLSKLTIQEGWKVGSVVDYDNQGAGILNLGTLSISECGIINCEASDYAGGVVNRGSLLMNQCTILNNIQGGVYSSGNVLRIFDSNISNNSTYGIGVIYSNAVVNDCIISGNTNDGVYFPFQGGLTIKNSQITGNGINGINLGGSMISNIFNCTIASNGNVGILNHSDTNFNLSNSIIAQNEIDVENLGSGDLLDIGNNIIGDATEVLSFMTNSTLLGSNLEPLDPLFMLIPMEMAPTSMGDFNLQACSPAINAGSIDTLGLNIGIDDLNGYPRIFNNRIDIGGYEYQDIPTTAYFDTLYAVSCSAMDTGRVVDTVNIVGVCDSIVTTITTLLESYNETVYLTTCDTESIGTAVDSFTANSGCDSIVTIITTLLESYNETVYLTTCDAESIGTTVDSFTANSGCDSIVTTITNLLESYNETVYLTTCDAELVGTTVDSFTANSGCDSIVTTITNLLESYHEVVDFTTCDAAATGTTTDTFQTIYGCDSIVTTNILLGEECNLECEVPQNLYVTNITLFQATLGWDEVAGVEKYKVQGRISNSLFGITVNRTVTDNMFRTRSLFPFLTYEFRVKTDCANEQSTWSNWESFILNPFINNGRIGNLSITEDLQELDLFDVSNIVSPYPNPTNGPVSFSFNVNEQLPVNIVVVDITGKTIRNDAVELGGQGAGGNLDLSDLTNGVYLIRLQKEDIILWTEKILIVH